MSTKNKNDELSFQHFFLQVWILTSLPAASHLLLLVNFFEMQIIFVKHRVLKTRNINCVCHLSNKVFSDSILFLNSRSICFVLCLLLLRKRRHYVSQFSLHLNKNSQNSFCIWFIWKVFNFIENDIGTSSHGETSRYDRDICAILSRAVLILLYVQWWSALLTLWSEHRNYSGILLTLYQLNNTIWFLIRHYSYLTQ